MARMSLNKSPQVPKVREKNIVFNRSNLTI